MQTLSGYRYCTYACTVGTLYNNSGQINLRDFGNDEFTKRPNRLIRKFPRNFSLAQKHFFFLRAQSS